MTPTNRGIPLALRLAAVLLLVPGGREAAAQDPPPAGDDPGAAFSADVRRFAAALREAPGYSVKVAESWRAVGGGEGERGTNRYELSVLRPGRFAIAVRPGEDEDPSIAVVGDGERVTTVFRGPPALHSVDRPRDPVEGLRRNPVLAQSLSGSYLDILMRPDAAEYVLTSLAAVERVGEEEVDGARATRYRGTWRDGREVEIWFAADAPHAPIRIRSTRTVAPAIPGQPLFRLVATCDFRWDLGASIDPGTFRLEPPADSKAVDDLYAELTGSGKAVRPGQPCPELDLETVDGGRLRLADHKGRHVVVLNFWATWYPTGEESLPTLAAFAKDFADRGVVVYQINMGEPPDLVRRYAEAHPELTNVALDPEGRATEAFAVRSLPFSLIVGKDGTIRAVNAGDLRDFRRRFREQLEALTSGADPAPEPRP